MRYSGKTGLLTKTDCKLGSDDVPAEVRPGIVQTTVTFCIPRCIVDQYKFITDHIHQRLYTYMYVSFGYWGHLFLHKAICNVVKGFVGLEYFWIRRFVGDTACMCLTPCACECTS